MNANLLESYLVGLGFSIDQPELRKFQDALRTAGEAVKRETSGIVRSLVEWQIGIAGAFATISGAVIGIADHTAMADQNFRLFGLRMMMTQDAARTLKMSMDALGQPLEVIAFDPEIHQRFVTLEGDINSRKKQLGPGFEQQMRSIRDLRFEFTRLKVALQFLGMKFVSDLFEKFGLTVDRVKAKLEGFLSGLKSGQLSEWANRLATEAVPVLKDFWQMLKAIGGAIAQAGVLFTNLVGLISGDSSIEGSSLSFEKLAKAFQHVTHWGAEFFQIVTLLERALGHLIAAVTDLFTGNFKNAGKELLHGFGDIGGALLSPMGGAAGGAAVGGLLGSMVAPGIGTWIGGLLGAKLGSYAGGKAQESMGGAGALTDLAPLYKTIQNNREAMQAIAAAAQKFHVNTALALGIAQQESGFDQNARSKAGAIGLMQLEPDTAKNLGVDPTNAQQNAEGGVQYFASLLTRYHGDIHEALAAYNAGPGKVDAALRSYGANWMNAMPAETQHYVPSVMRRAQQFGDVNVKVYVNQPGASAEKIGRQTSLQIQRDIAQMSPGH